MQWKAAAGVEIFVVVVVAVSARGRGGLRYMSVGVCVSQRAGDMR